MTGDRTNAEMTTSRDGRVARRVAEDAARDDQHGVADGRDEPDDHAEQPARARRQEAGEEDAADRRGLDEVR